MTPSRFILHVDMDAFFASVEQLDHPPWRGKPLIVAHDGARGVVSAASYEARVFGCRSAQPTIVAKRLCPHVIIAPVRFARYREVSRQIFTIFENYTPLVEPLSVDEAFLDVTASIPLFGPADEIARRIRADIRKQTGVTASVGVAPNKFLAKLASDMNKPDGLTVLDAGNIDTVLPPLPIERMWGVGPKTAEKLRGLGIKTFGDLARCAPDVLKRRVGEDADRWQRLALGQDQRPVTPDHDAKSVGHEQTFGENLPHADEVRAVLIEQCELVAARLRKSGISARSVTVKIRYGDFETITRRTTLDRPTDVTRDLWQAASSLFDAWASSSFRPVRLIGMQAGALSRGAGQLELFADEKNEKQKRLDRAIDRINGKFGKQTVNRRLM